MTSQLFLQNAHANKKLIRGGAVDELVFDAKAGKTKRKIAERSNPKKVQCWGQ